MQFEKPEEALTFHRYDLESGELVFCNDSVAKQADISPIQSLSKESPKSGFISYMLSAPLRLFQRTKLFLHQDWRNFSCGMLPSNETRDLERNRELEREMERQHWKNEIQQTLQKQQEVMDMFLESRNETNKLKFMLENHFTQYENNLRSTVNSLRLTEKRLEEIQTLNEEKFRRLEESEQTILDEFKNLERENQQDIQRDHNRSDAELEKYQAAMTEKFSHIQSELSLLRSQMKKNDVQPKFNKENQSIKNMSMLCNLRKENMKISTMVNDIQKEMKLLKKKQSRQRMDTKLGSERIQVNEKALKVLQNQVNRLPC